MNIATAEFIKSCTSSKQYPSHDLPELAFMGRSNVGKSSLINAVTGRKQLVKTGSKPGVTKTINFFIVNGNISIADLPGFGYAKIPMEMKKQFLPMIRDYIRNRKNLRLVFLLIDIRRIPGEEEFSILSLLTGNRIPVAVTVTKCDKISRNRREAQLKSIAGALEIDMDSLFVTSSLKKEGREEILDLIEEYAS